MDNYNFCDKHTDTQMDVATDPAQSTESVKIVRCVIQTGIYQIRKKIINSGTSTFFVGRFLLSLRKVG